LRPNIDEIDDEIDDVVSGFFAGGSSTVAARLAVPAPRLLRDTGFSGAACGTSSAFTVSRWPSKIVVSHFRSF
jgi:hypothetical protein